MKGEINMAKGYLVADIHVRDKDGLRQAVLAVYIIKDGKIISSETGLLLCQNNLKLYL